MNTTYIWTDPQRMGGRPCLRGHRITVAQLLQEIMDDPGRMHGVAARFSLPLQDLRGMVSDVTQWLNEPSGFAEQPQESVA
jgi:uncharacterized protein (DUF433 family)